MIDVFTTSLFFIATITFVLGLFCIKKVFILLAKNTLNLLNTLIDKHITEDEKQTQLIRLTKGVLGPLFLLISSMIIISFLSYMPFYFGGISAEHIDVVSFEFLIANITCFLLYKGVRLLNKKNKNYTEWSKLLHHLILDNYNIERFLFQRERKKYVRTPRQKQPYLIVTGFARSGTTAFTNFLYSSNQFESLSYANMPFLMAVRFWRKLYNPKKIKLKERSHKDGLSIGLNSVEALEEHFFKVQLNDSYIDQQSLRKHAVAADIIEQYKDYRNLVQDNPKKTYLAKNNNLLLRLESQLEQDDELNVVLLYRNPLQHAASVLKQYQNFIQQQESDPFITTYMNWLGHHEFGKNHLPFEFESFNNSFSTDSLNYHLQNWINYYQYALTYKNKDQILFVQFEKFIENPINIANTINERFPFNLTDCKAEHHDPKPHEIDESKCDVNLLSQANEIFAQLQASS